MKSPRWEYKIITHSEEVYSSHTNSIGMCTETKRIIIDNGDNVQYDLSKKDDIVSFIEKLNY